MKNENGWRSFLIIEKKGFNEKVPKYKTSPVIKARGSNMFLVVKVETEVYKHWYTH